MTKIEVPHDPKYHFMTDMTNQAIAWTRFQQAMTPDQALARLAPQMRDVLVSRFLADESCAEIGRRYGRTEQSVSGWVRQAVQEMKIFLTEQAQGPAQKIPHD